MALLSMQGSRMAAFRMPRAAPLAAARAQPPPTATKTAARRAVAVAAAAAAEDAAGAYDDDIDWTEDMPTPVRRRVAALREVQARADEVNRAFVRERAELEAKYAKQLAPLQDERAAVVSGAAAVGDFGIAAPEGAADEPDSGIPDFWLTAMTNHEMVGELVTERDAEVLSYLTDVRCAPLTGDDAGSFRLTFAFRENPHFTNATLEKTFYMEDPDEVVPRKFVGSKIDWQAGKDTTVAVVKKRVADKKGGKKGGAAATVTRTEPCASFFNFFRTPVVPESPDDLSEEDLEALQEQMDEDYEVGVAFKESLVPRAVEWFTGEAAPPLYDMDEGDEGDEGEWDA